MEKSESQKKAWKMRKQKARQPQKLTRTSNEFSAFSSEPEGAYHMCFDCFYLHNIQTIRDRRARDSQQEARNV